ncbi:hypothetical protein Pmar_PMAR005833 [Perkinsus marinus ATCC 50983]|uniref:Uncharacterized protein n=1 Tax=Perkinsus marinus (strain ATCC 50983 / TXsc) TaxID=423536 RepID=C5KYC1_PERM5|nr:hypothetical protein Pmar_PMAR005833 [Perkinsus marinus ATCC 50983]EER10498.1 hypothetical protein Pmar_PMAR005833 [Perkinsus marinus ATCC 50983]|eukprot:XP_002778703.1 hypothetical protein Pmar_PMAR005833 [Perkinsus marinus ATCC 50983]
MGAHGSRESQRPKAFTKGGGDVVVSMSKPMMLDTPRRSEDDSKGLREVNPTWTLFIILQVHDAGHSGALEKTFKIMQLPLTDLAVFVNVDSIFRVSLYAARDKETVQKLLDTDDYLSNLEELPVMPTGTERTLKSFASDDSEPASPATSTRSSQMYADAYLAGECVVPVRAVGERFGSGMVMQWIALDSKGLRTDGCLEGDGCTQVAKGSRSLTSSPNRDCILASLREYKALSVDCVRQAMVIDSYEQFCDFAAAIMSRDVEA